MNVVGLVASLLIVSNARTRFESFKPTILTRFSPVTESCSASVPGVAESFGKVISVIGIFAALAVIAVLVVRSWYSVGDEEGRVCESVRVSATGNLVISTLPLPLQWCTDSIAGTQSLK